MDEIEGNLAGEETWEEGVDGFIKFVSQEERMEEGTIEYLDLDMEAIQEAEEYQPMPIVSSQKKRQRSRDKSPSQSSLRKKTAPNELSLRPKYRPIRPKPQSPTKPNKFQSLTPIVNFNSAPGFIVAAPPAIKKEKVEETFVASPLKGINCSKVTNGASMVRKENLPAAQNEAQNGKVRHRNTPKSSIELFFESMAKTVLNLPTHVQAEIKMEICKVVTMAEIKYLSDVRADKRG